MSTSSDITTLARRGQGRAREQEERRPSLLLRYPAVLALPPFLALVWFVARFSVNVPVTDQWGLSYLFYAVKTGKASIANFWVPNNEHRVFFPKLIWTALAFSTSWNTRYEMALSVGLAALAFLAIWRVAEAQREHSSASVYALATFATSALLFSLSQYESWLWGYQLAFVLVQTCVALAIMLLARADTDGWRSFVLSAGCCAVASFSSAQGLFSWIALAPMLWTLAPSARNRKLKLLVWTGLFIGAALIYNIGYKLPHASRVAPDRLYAFKHPLIGVGFFLALVGAPLAEGQGNHATELAGVLLLTIFAYLAWRSCSQPSLRKASIPWISFGAFTLCFAAITTIGRAGWQIDAAARESRYTSHDILIAIAIVQLGRLLSGRSLSYVVTCPNCGHKSAAGRVSGQRLFAIWIVVVLIALGVTSSYAIQQAKSLKREREQGRALLPLLPYIDPQTDSSIQSPFFGLFTVRGLAGWVRVPAHLLDQIGFRKTARDVAFVESSPSVLGGFKKVVSYSLSDGTAEIAVSGWAAYAASSERPAAVLISCDDKKQFIAAAMIGIKTPDVAEAMSEPRYLHAGWETSFPASFLPPGDNLLKAWVFDSKKNQFVRLADSGGEHHVIVTQSTAQQPGVD